MFKNSDSIVRLILTALALALWGLAASINQPLALVMLAIVLNVSVVRLGTLAERVAACWIPLMATALVQGLYVGWVSAMFLAGAAILGLIVAPHVIERLRCYSGVQEQPHDATLDEDADECA